VNCLRRECRVTWRLSFGCQSGAWPRNEASWNVAAGNAATREIIARLRGTVLARRTAFSYAIAVRKSGAQLPSSVAFYAGCIQSPSIRILEIYSSAPGFYALCMPLPYIQGVSKTTLQWYTKYCCVANITYIFTLKGLHTIHRSRCSSSL
jgi:hypothetical protein